MLTISSDYSHTDLLLYLNKTTFTIERWTLNHFQSCEKENLLVTIHMAKQKKVSTVVICCDSDDNDIHVPQAWSLHISRDGWWVVETPRSPQKQAVAPQPSPHYEWNPSNDHDYADEDRYMRIGESMDETSTTIPHVISKVASKRYLTSVGRPPILQSSANHLKGQTTIGMVWKAWRWHWLSTGISCRVAEAGGTRRCSSMGRALYDVQWR